MRDNNVAIEEHEIVANVSFMQLTTMGFTFRLILERYDDDMIGTRRYYQGNLDEIQKEVKGYRTYDEWRQANAKT